MRLYVRDTIFGYKRSKSNQYETVSLVQIEGVNTREDVAWYGARLCVMQRAAMENGEIKAAEEGLPMPAPPVGRRYRLVGSDDSASSR
ncbi:60S ribosomal protein L33-B [Hordeum vulgare]|nr:60S ribosomal protein L33-B [Hordeum vulgare]